MASLSLNHHNLLLLLLLLRSSCNLHFTTAIRPQVFENSDWISEKSTDKWKLKEIPQDPEHNSALLETNTLRYWSVVPSECVEYVKNYMVGIQYLLDSNTVANQSIVYANSLNISGDGKDVWVFDVDETLLSNLPLYSAYNYGGKEMDEEAFIKWADLAADPALPASHRLYTHLLQLGFKIFLLTGRYDYERNSTEKNLIQAGYHSWEELFLRGTEMDEEAFIKWADLATDPALPASHRLYTHLLQLGFKIFLLTGRYDYERNSTEKNLIRAGYHSWEELFLREPDEYETTGVVYKYERRSKIEKDGFRIQGNSGDQWSDLSGYSIGHRTFKVPNPDFTVFMCFVELWKILPLLSNQLTR